MRSSLIPICAICTALAFGCSREDTEQPILVMVPDTDLHYRLEPYTDPGVDVADDQTCLRPEDVIVDNPVDVTRYGTYMITYSATDAAGNTALAQRPVDIILPLEDYYDQNWQAYDTCTSGNYQYTGLVQDCDCDAMAVTVGNISNFGLSASFTLPVSGIYNHMVTLDTIKAAVYFEGSGIMSVMADTLFWNYTIADSVSADVCRSVWIK